MTRVTLVQMIIAAAHESSADGAFIAVAWSQVISHDNYPPGVVKIERAKSING